MASIDELADMLKVDLGHIKVIGVFLNHQSHNITSPPGHADSPADPLGLGFVPACELQF